MTTMNVRETMPTAHARRLATVRPRDRAELRGWVRAVLGIDVPDRATCAGHDSPMDYLEHVFFEKPGDAVVWANRGGGKTFYGAVATLLDLLFKPGIEVRVLGGSFDQSSKMYGYLRSMLDRDGLRPLVEGKMTRRGVALTNGSRVELLAQSETSVRGSRVQRLRCDEVELFDADVWRAAQFVTRSDVCGETAVRGSIEVMSTMHRPFGLMHDLVGGAGGGGTEVSRPSNEGRRVFTWCALDVMGQCEAERECEGCVLWSECGGRAKDWRGFVSVEDVIAQKTRSSETAWEAEMLCRRPSVDAAVYPMFDRSAHVAAVGPDRSLRWVGGMDFGFVDPLVMLWAQLRPRMDGASGFRVEVIDEMIAREETTQKNVEAIGGRGWPGLRWVGVDPAGGQRQSQTGSTDIALLRDAGMRVRTRASRIRDGIELVRRRLSPAVGEPTLVIHPRCRELIGSLTAYHFDPQRPGEGVPVKDGPDHAADALRYLVVNLDRPSGRVTDRRY